MKRTSRVAPFVTAVILALCLNTGTLAQNAASPQVTQKIIGGHLTYSISNGTMAPIAFDYTGSQNAVADGSVMLTVDDARGTREGWSIDLEASAFAYDGQAPGNNDISAGNASVIPNSPSLLAGEGMDGVQAGAGGTLDRKRTVITASEGSGSGKFTQELTIRLDIPPASPTGSYIALLTVSSTAAPGN